MPFIVGVPRSGTTLLRFMLDAHPDLAIPPETGFLALGRALGDDADPRRRFYESVTDYPPGAAAWPDFGIAKDALWDALTRIEPFSLQEGCRAFYRLYAAKFGKPRWGDKTPTYGLYLPAVTELLPEAHVIHLVRDGRDVALSLRQTWFSPGNRMETLADYWKQTVLTTRASGQAWGRYLEIRFEDLVRDPERAIVEVCRFLDLDYDPRMLEYHRGAPTRLTEHRDRVQSDGTVIISHEGRLRQQALTVHPPQSSRIGAWRTDMTPDERRTFESIAGDALRELGY